MADEIAKVKFTINIPFDRPNKNGTVFTQKAVENAVRSIPKHIPIICSDGECKFSNKVIGTTVDEPKFAAWDFENQVCTMEVDGAIFRSGVDIIVNEIQDNVISDFRIRGIALLL